MDAAGPVLPLLLHPSPSLTTHSTGLSRAAPSQAWPLGVSRRALDDQDRGGAGTLQSDGLGTASARHWLRVSRLVTSSLSSVFSPAKWEEGGTCLRGVLAGLGFGPSHRPSLSGVGGPPLPSDSILGIPTGHPTTASLGAC